VVASTYDKYDSISIGKPVKQSGPRTQRGRKLRGRIAKGQIDELDVRCNTGAAVAENSHNCSVDQVNREFIAWHFFVHDTRKVALRPKHGSNVNSTLWRFARFCAVIPVDDEASYRCTVKPISGDHLRFPPVWVIDGYAITQK
jgi:hypothetical protein